MNVRVGHGAVRDDPLPDPDLPKRVGIPQQDFADRQKDQIGARTGKQRNQCPHKAAEICAIGDRVGDGDRHLHLVLAGQAKRMAPAALLDHGRNTVR
jgi:hypothetical protein